MLSQDQFRDQLAELTNPYNLPSSEDNQLFARAMEESDHWHKHHNPVYASIWQGDSRPLMPLSLFRQNKLYTIRDTKDGLWHDCSLMEPDTAAPVFIDAAGMRRIRLASSAIFRHYGFSFNKPANFLLLAPDPRQGQRWGYGEIFLQLTACAPIRELHFAVDEDLRLDTELAWTLLTQWSKQSDPVFLFGLSSFFEQLCLSGNKVLDFQGPLLGLTSGACTSPDWVAKRAGVIAGMEARLRGRQVQVRDMYGMNEHPLHYISCSEGNFHVPLFSRFVVVGADGEPALKGRIGLIRLQNPFLDSLPSHDLLTEDFGIWGKACACGEALPFFHFLGRLAST